MPSGTPQASFQQAQGLTSILSAIPQDMPRPPLPVGTLAAALVELDAYKNLDR